MRAIFLGQKTERAHTCQVERHVDVGKFASGASGLAHLLHHQFIEMEGEIRAHFSPPSSPWSPYPASTPLDRGRPRQRASVVPPFWPKPAARVPIGGRIGRHN